MKIQVRNNVFETNSSSMHSIAIVKPENLKGTVADYYGWELTNSWLKPGEEVVVNHPIVMDDDSINFERWPFRILSTMYEKAQYAIASYGTEEKFKEISNICKKRTGHGLKTPTERKDVYFYTEGLKRNEDGDWIIPDDHILDPYNTAEFDQEKHEWYRLDANANRVYDIKYFVDEVPYYGYVDHQSCGVLQYFLEKHNMTLEEFLLDPKCVVIIDGDEYCAWQKMFDAGICLHENFIETGLRN